MIWGGALFVRFFYGLVFSLLVAFLSFFSTQKVHAQFSGIECIGFIDVAGPGPLTGYGTRCFGSIARVDILPVSLSDAERSFTGDFISISNFTLERSEIIISLGSAASNISLLGATISRNISTNVFAFNASTAASVNAIVFFDSPAGRHSFRIVKAAGSNAIQGFRIVDFSIPGAQLNGGVANIDGVTSNENISMLLHFTEDIAGLDVNSFDVTNGTVTNVELTGGFDPFFPGPVYRVTVQHNGAGVGTIQLPSLAVQSLSGGNSTASNLVTFTIVDDIAPTLTVVDFPRQYDGSRDYSVRFEFSEDVVNFDETDLSLSNGVISNFTTVDNRTYTATFTPSSNSIMRLDIASGAAQDAVGLDSNSVTLLSFFTADSNQPTVQILNAPTQHDGVTPFTVLVQFSEEVENFEGADVFITNGSVTGFSVSRFIDFTVEITPTGNGDILLNIPAGVARDLTLNDNIASNTVTVMSVAPIDNISPSVQVLNVPTTHDGVSPFNVTFEFSEEVQNFLASDITLTNGLLSNLATVDNTTFTADITPSGGSDVSISVAANVAQDLAGNDNSASNVVLVAHSATVTDTTPPTVQVLNVPTTHDGVSPFNVTFDFSEEVQNFLASDVTLTNGLLSNLASVDNTTFTADITPSGGSDVSISVAANVVQDLAGNNNTASNIRFVQYAAPVSDTTAPSVIISDAPSFHDGSTSFNLSFQFSEDVQDFELQDIVTTNSSLSSFNQISSSRYTVNVTPIGEESISVIIPFGAAQDLAGNQNTIAQAVVEYKLIVEETQRTINRFLQSRANTILRSQPGFARFIKNTHLGGSGKFGDLSVNANGAGHSLSFFTSRSKINNGLQAIDAVAGIPKGTIYGEADSNVHSNDSTSEIPVGVIGGIRGSIDGVTSEKKLSGVVLGKGIVKSTKNSGEATSETINHQHLNQDRSGTWDVWSQFHSSRSTLGNANSTQNVGYLGTHYFLSNESLVGILAQFDWAGQTDASNGSEIDGRGWMIGPYIAGKVKDQNLYYEARLAYGHSSNEVSVATNISGKFSTERILASGSISGVFEENNYFITPEMRVSYFRETQESYVDSDANLIPKQTIGFGELEFGPSVSRSFDDQKGNVWTPTLGVKGIYNFGTVGTDLVQQNNLIEQDVRLELNAGLEITNAYGYNFVLNGYYDGIGQEGYEGFGGDLGMRIPLQ